MSQSKVKEYVKRVRYIVLFLNLHLQGRLGVWWAHIVPGRKKRHEALFRALAAEFLREQCGLSAPEVGGIVNSDHTTVLSGIRRLQDWRLVAPDWITREKKKRDELLRPVTWDDLENVRRQLFFPVFNIARNEAARVMNLPSESVTTAIDKMEYTTGGLPPLEPPPNALVTLQERSDAFKA